MQDLSSKTQETLVLNELGPDWYPALISLDLGICLYARGDQPGNKLCLRLISAVVEELDVVRKETLTSGVK